MIIHFPGNPNPVRRVLFPQVVEFCPVAIAQRQQRRVNQVILLNAPIIVTITLGLTLWAMWCNR